MKKQIITRQTTITGQLMYLLFITFMLVLVTDIIAVGRISALIVLGIIFVVLAAFVYKIRRQDRLIKSRVQKLQNHSSLVGGNFIPLPQYYSSEFSLMSLSDLGDQRDRQYRNFVTTDAWTYCDYSYAIYKETKNGEYKAYAEHYGVMTAKLPRSLPNVFFDSLSARKRQFRFHFTRKQRHSLEGDFDKFFATYFPEEYTIDSMSFISPEVMWALREAGDYDIEIVGNRLFLYGPLYEPAEQIKDMAEKLTNIKNKLLNNIVTYRDERLPYEVGRERVTVQAENLKRSQLLTRLGLAAGILFWILYIFLQAIR